MNSLSVAQTPSFPFLLRRHVNQYATNPYLFSASPSYHCLSLKLPPTLPFHILYRLPNEMVFRTSFLSFRRRFAITAAFPTPGNLLQDIGATTAVLAGAYSLVFTFNTLTHRKLIEQNLSRKLVHILSGLLFVISWPIFSTSTMARYFATLVPLVNCFRLVIHGLSLATDEGLIKSVTREGKPEELLRGPLYYVLILILCALMFWRESPVGIISVAMMCGGDGVADIMGRRFGSMKLPYNQQKSWMGSLSMFICGFLMAVGMLYYYSALGYFQFGWMWTIQMVALIALLATLVESLPTTEFIDDNISVPLTSMLAAYLCFSF